MSTTIKAFHIHSLSAIGLLVGFAIMVSACSSEKAETVELATIKKAPVFTAVNFDGTSFDTRELDGTVWIASFFFTRCGGPCPTLSARMAEFQTAYRGRSDVRFVSITVDPEYDSREVLAKYAAKYNAEIGTWYMVRMSPEETRNVAANGFLLGAPDNPALHSTRFAIIDRNGDIRGFFDGMDEKAVEQLRTAVDRLLETPSVAAG